MLLYLCMYVSACLCMYVRACVRACLCKCAVMFMLEWKMNIAAQIDHSVELEI